MHTNKSKIFNVRKKYPLKCVVISLKIILNGRRKKKPVLEFTKLYLPLRNVINYYGQNGSDSAPC